MAKKMMLEEWLAAAVSDPDKEPQGCTAFVLHHTFAGGKKGEFVHKIARGSSEWDLKRVHEVFTAKAKIFVQERPGRQVFRVFAFYGGNGDTDSANAAFFEFAMEREDEGVGHLSEEPDARGRASQEMRHNEALGAMYIHGTDTLMGHLLEHNRQLAMEASNLRHDNSQNFELMKSMILDAESRGHEMRMKEMDFEQKSVFYKKAIELAGPLLNTVTGREIVPQAFADTQLLEAVVMHMANQEDGTESGDALMKMMSGFPQHIQVSLITRAHEIMARKRKEKEDIRKMNPFADPAADAAGEMPNKLPNGGTH